MPDYSNTLLSLSATELFHANFGPEKLTGSAFAPGRVNLIGEHIDYHNLAVLPMAIARGVSVAYRVRADARISAVSAAGFALRSKFDLDSIATAGSKPGDWGNYLKAAALVAQASFGISRGIDAAVVSNLPIAAGLSSSSALLIAFTLSLLAANQITPTLQQLMKVLPDGEQFVGTRGGGMDHAAILASHRGHATHLRFDPLVVSHVPIPRDWRFLVADSLHAAEKSSGLVYEYNSRRYAGTAALRKLGFASYQEAIAADRARCVASLSVPEEQRAFLHVVEEATRVRHAVDALEADDLSTLGALLNESHRSLRDHLRVSTPAIDALVTTALEAGAAGARLTGAGFGGCMVAVCSEDIIDQVRDTLKLRHYAHLSPANLENHLFAAEPASGAMEILDGR